MAFEDNIDSLINKQDALAQVITFIIVNNETSMFETIGKNFNDNKLDILCEDMSNTVILMIEYMTNRSFNKIYHDIQNDSTSDLVNKINYIAQDLPYGKHVLVEKILKLTLDVHTDIVRSNLVVTDDKNIDKYIDSLMIEINASLQNKNFYYILTDYDENTDTRPWIHVDNDTQVFDVKITKSKTVDE